MRCQFPSLFRASAGGTESRADIASAFYASSFSHCKLDSSATTPCALRGAPTAKPKSSFFGEHTTQQVGNQRKSFNSPSNRNSSGGSGSGNKGWVIATSTRSMMGGRIARVTPGPGQESVWDYPRPPRVERVARRVRVVFDGKTVADSSEAYRVLETSHPPVYYIPQKDIDMTMVHKSSGGSSFCEWKGSATYWTVTSGKKTLENVGWSYESPTPRFVPIKSHIAFYCAPMDACYVGEEKAEPQPGGFYGGWITSDVVGPFKGGHGSWGW